MEQVIDNTGWPSVGNGWWVYGVYLVVYLYVLEISVVKKLKTKKDIQTTNQML